MRRPTAEPWRTMTHTLFNSSSAPPLSVRQSPSESARCHGVRGSAHALITPHCHTTRECSTMHSGPHASLDRSAALGSTAARADGRARRYSGVLRRGRTGGLGGTREYCGTLHSWLGVYTAVLPVPSAPTHLKRRRRAMRAAAVRRRCRRAAVEAVEALVRSRAALQRIRSATAQS
jgi:hypothetical protein